MKQRTIATVLVAATWALAACGVSSRDADGIRAAGDAPPLRVELRSLPEGHPPVPGYFSSPTLPEGHPPVDGLRSAPALPEGHPRCPARGPLGAPPADAGPEPMLHGPAGLIST